MASVRYLLGIFCLGFIGQFDVPDRRFLRSSNTPSSVLRSTIVTIAGKEIGVRERTGKNDGASVEAYLAYTGNKKGASWCASFISWIYGQAGLSKPRSAWSPALFPRAKLVLQPQMADLFAIYFQDQGRIAHCGLVRAVRKDWIYTIEGNTNISGIRNGDGVYAKIRHRRTIYGFADWITKGRREAQDEK